MTEAAFNAPNYTQVPNSLWELIPVMGEAELKVTMAVCRMTFGYHRKRARASLKKMMEMTGMSKQGVQNGAKAAEERGTLRRIVDMGVTIWEAVVVEDDGEEGESEVVNEVDQVVNEVDRGGQRSRPGGQRGRPDGQRSRPPSIKESIKENDLNKSARVARAPDDDEMPDFGNMTPLEVKHDGRIGVYVAVTGRYPPKSQLPIIWKVIKKHGFSAAQLQPYWDAWVANGFRVNNLAWLVEWAVNQHIPQRPGAKKGDDVTAADVVLEESEEELARRREAFIRAKSKSGG